MNRYKQQLTATKFETLLQSILKRGNHLPQWFYFEKDTIMYLGVGEISEPVPDDWPIFNGLDFDTMMPIINQTPQFVIYRNGEDYQVDGFGNIDDYLSHYEIDQAKLTGTISDSSQQDDQQAWLSKTNHVIDRLHDGQDVLQKVVLGQQKQIRVSGQLNFAQLRKDLNDQFPTTYHVIAKQDAMIFVSATPERLAKFTPRTIETAAVAGTIGRLADPMEDDKLAQKLRNDPKNRTEHQFVIDEIKNRFKEHQVTVLPTQILKSGQVQHLYTPIMIAKDQITVKEALTILHPTPALGGVPTDEAKRVIGAVETTPRQLFAAPIGWYNQLGEGEYVVGIRSFLATKKDKEMKISYFAGAGIVKDSDANLENQEIQLKMQGMKAIIQKQFNYGGDNE